MSIATNTLATQTELRIFGEAQGNFLIQIALPDDFLTFKHDDWEAWIGSLLSHSSGAKRPPKLFCPFCDRRSIARFNPEAEQISWGDLALHMLEHYKHAAWPVHGRLDSPTIYNTTRLKLTSVEDDTLAVEHISQTSQQLVPTMGQKRECLHQLSTGRARPTTRPGLNGPSTHFQLSYLSSDSSPTELVTAVVALLDLESSSHNIYRDGTDMSGYLPDASFDHDLAESEVQSPPTSHGTESTCSSDETDWDEDSMLDFEESTIDDEGRVQKWDIEVNNSTVSEQMTSSQTLLIGRLMDDFWKVFNDNYTSQTGRACAEGPSASSSNPKKASVTNSSRSRSSKRPRDNGGDDSDNDCGRLPRKGGSQSLRDDNSDTSLRAHLYTYHYIHQCQRCMEVFNSEDELDGHVKAPEPCPSRIGHPADGITSKMKAQLQCRKKTHRNQTEEDRWFQIYRILFTPKADEIIPNPYFEPIRDHEVTHANGQTPQFQDIDSFQGYLRRELPRFFSTVLENAVTRELNPIEERLRSELVDLMQEAQNNAFSSWRAMHGIDVDSRLSREIPTTVDLVATSTSVENTPDQAILDQSLPTHTQLLSRIVSHGSDSGYTSDPARSRSSQEAPFASSHEEANLSTQDEDDNMIEPILSDHSTAFDMANPFNDMDLADNSLLLSDDMPSNALAQDQDDDLESRLMFNDCLWADNFDNLDLHYTALGLSSSWDSVGSQIYTLR
ncbi:uncharacterized protein PAC_11189 [Phialocephala subalpina]|uniref:C2H2-type domain-containing protein n=1 Tax=Phialocephala subalpina TaxID=576137 RepID=A0A1L7X8E3_9HELO|nr:uncharacterized protein PAC_11189 [Phialocephala subalpina]